MATGLNDYIDKKIKMLEQAALYSVRDLGVELEKAYENAIKEFYNSYRPIRYRRTLYLRYGSSGFKQPWSKLGHRWGSMWVAEIKVGDEFYPDDPYPRYHVKRDNYFPKKDYVFPRAWAQGIHGFTMGEAKAPGWRNNDSTDSKYVGSTVKFRADKGRNYRVPPRSTPPRWIFKRSFKDISNPGHVAGVVKKHIKD